MNLDGNSMFFPCPGQLVAVKVTPELSKLVRPGDTLLELDGQPLTHQKQLHQPKGAVQLKLVRKNDFNKTRTIQYSKKINK